MHRCLSKDPNGRYPTVFELSAALEPFRPYDDDVHTSRRIRAILAAPSSGSALTSSEPRVEDIPTTLASTREAGGDLRRTRAEHGAGRRSGLRLVLVAGAVVVVSGVGFVVRATWQPSRADHAIVEASSTPHATGAPHAVASEAAAPAAHAAGIERVESAVADAGAQPALSVAHGSSHPRRAKPATKSAPPPRTASPSVAPPPPVVNRSRPGDTM